MRSRAAVVDAVAALELVDFPAELELDASGQHDEELFRIAVRVGLRAGRSTGIELAGEDLEMLQRPGGEQQLPAENPEGERGPLVAAEHARPRRPARLEQVRDAHAERARDPAQGGDARARPPALDLAQEALADAGALRDRSQRGAPQSADVPQA